MPWSLRFRMSFIRRLLQRWSGRSHAVGTQAYEAEGSDSFPSLISPPVPRCSPVPAESLLYHLGAAGACAGVNPVPFCSRESPQCCHTTQTHPTKSYCTKVSSYFWAVCSARFSFTLLFNPGPFELQPVILKLLCHHFFAVVPRGPFLSLLPGAVVPALPVFAP